MATRDYLVEIQGEPTAFTGAGSNPTPTWGQTLSEAVVSPPPIQTTGVGPYDGTYQHGGNQVNVAGVETYLRSRGTDPQTTLTADLTASGTTATVTSTSAFPSSGTIWIDREAMTYSGKTATTFTGLTRAAYGTEAKAHEATTASGNKARPVYGYNPTWFGRKVWVHTFDPTASSITLTTIAVGYCDGIVMDEREFTLDLLSVAQRLEEQSIASSARALGSLLGVVDRTARISKLGDALPHDGKGIELVIELDDPETPFEYDATATAGQLAKVAQGWFAMGEETLRYRRSAYPAWDAPVNNTGSTTFGPRIQTIVPPYLTVGHTIRFTDSATSEVVDATITLIVGDWITHNAVGKAPAVASRLSTPTLQRLADFERGQAGTDPADHEAGAELEQVYVQSADHVDAVLQLLLSGNGSGGTYDVLPNGLGAGLSDSEIDLDSFDSLRPYSVPHTYVLREPASPRDVLVQLAQATGGRVYVSQVGKITARRDFAPYPDLGTVRTLTSEDFTSIPVWDVRTARIYNHWVWKFRGNVTSVFEVDASKSLYGERAFPEPPSRVEAFAAGVSLGAAEAIAVATLLRYSDPTPEITVEIPADESDVLEPGQLVALTILHQPSLDGSGGITAQSFEVIEFSPNEETATVRLLRLPPQGNVGLVGPAGIIASVSGNDITLEPTSTSHLAMDTDRTGTALEAVIGSGEDGTEDVDWFLAGDIIQLIDVSTLGSGSSVADHLVSAVNYSTRTITLSTIPAWVAAGDRIRLCDYGTVPAFKQSVRHPYFLWWADNTPTVGAGDDPYEWGM